MVYSRGCNGFYIANGQCMYNGNKIPNPPRFNTNRLNLTTINNKLYLNGYEYSPKKHKWKITIKSIWHFIF